MNIQSENTYTIFRDDINGRTYYKINMFKKDKKEDKVVYGTMNCRFKRNVEVNNKQKIKLNKAWISFYINNKNNTVPYIFIDNFELVNE